MKASGPAIVGLDLLTLTFWIHWKHEPILVAHKTLTKSSTYVKFVIKFVGTTNLTNFSNFRKPLNHNNYGYASHTKLKLWGGFAAHWNVFTNLTYVEDFVKVLWATKMGSCLQWYIQKSYKTFPWPHSPEAYWVCEWVSHPPSETKCSSLFSVSVCLLHNINVRLSLSQPHPELYLTM